MAFHVIRPKGISISSLRRGPFYTVASIELGNTTTKCILVTTNLSTGELFEVTKEVRFTRDIRPPRENEEIFGKTIFGTPLTREAVAEFVSETLLSAVKKARLDFHKDLHFVVRSTGVTAGFARPSEVGEMVKALAEGCINAGVPPRKMTASLTPDNLPPSIRDYTWLHKVYFDGAIAGCLPPANTEIVANEMEGELVTAGIKGAAKSSGIDFRSPVMTLDFGTTLAGRLTDQSLPYAKTIGSFTGLAGAIPDAIIRGTGLVDQVTGNVLDIAKTHSSRHVKIDKEWINEANDLISVERVPKGVHRYGTVPVNTDAAEESDVILIGVDVGTNGSRLNELTELGKALYESGGLSTVLSAIDELQVTILQRIVSRVESEGLLLPETALGLTGRAIITGHKPRLIVRQLQLATTQKWVAERTLVFVHDGLAIGAGVAARCMNSLGTPHNPLGGKKGGPCIMTKRMQLQKKNHMPE